MTKQVNLRMNTQDLAKIELLMNEMPYCETVRTVIETALDIACEKYDIHFGDILQTMAAIELREEYK